MTDKSLKDRIQESPTIFFLAAILTGFGAGIGAYKAILQIAQLRTISSQRYDELEQSNKKLGELGTDLQQAKQLNAVLQSRIRTASSSERHSGTSEMVPTLRAVTDFLATPAPSNYQWDGLAADDDKLNSFMQQFLDELQNHPVDYRQAASFYNAVMEAGAEVSRRAQKTFVPSRESGSGLEQERNYNQKVFVGPGWFLIHVQNLRLKHEEGGLRKGEFDEFRNTFNDWRKHEAGI